MLLDNDIIVVLLSDNNEKQHKMTVSQLTKKIEKFEKKLQFSWTLKAGEESELWLQVDGLRAMRRTLEKLETQLKELDERLK